MLYQGNAIQLLAVQDGILNLTLDVAQSDANVLNQAAFTELRQAIDLVKQHEGLQGLIVSSAKKDFVLGADITEFIGLFAGSPEDVLAATSVGLGIFNDIEDLPVPTVTAVNGLCLGGGFELAMATDFRVLTENAKVGLPEVNLGICPGLGGTVRLPRLIGPENALEWMVTGRQNRAPQALATGAADAVVDAELLNESALDILLQCIEGKLDYLKRRKTKTGPLSLGTTEAAMSFETAKGMVFAQAGPHYPAPMGIVKAVEQARSLARDEALTVEQGIFAGLGATEVATSLIGLFLNSQVLKNIARKQATAAQPFKRAAVLGAGIMGGGIAYQSALKGVPAVLKDIDEAALAAGMGEATKQLNKRVSKGRMTTQQMAEVIATIRPSLKMADLAEVDILVEAVVENPDIKKSVLSEVEQHVSESTILTSNTSTISISDLSSALEHPERFCGMHFFNPVPVMPLVEIIRGEHSDERTIATVVAYASTMGKTPIVVNDCPGFLVNRILFPYFQAFNFLVRDGADFRQIDKTMEGFGWPMGPAYLQDVVGVDTCYHCVDVLAAGYPDRMGRTEKTILDLLFENQRFGQKNGVGYYHYRIDRKGKPKKHYEDDVQSLISTVQPSSRDFSAEEIIARMMTPLCLEAVRCLEEGVVNTAAEADMALIMGVGFPRFRGGALRYIDTLGADRFCKMAEPFAALGASYQPTPGLLEMAAAGKTFFRY